MLISLPGYSALKKGIALVVVLVLIASCLLNLHYFSSASYLNLV